MQTTLSTNNEDSLRLTGNQIKLTTRSLENNSTASSRCALLGRGVSRCASVVPLLNLRYNEFDYSKSSRRPFSADFPFEKFVNPYPTKMSNRSPDIATSSEEETDANLPSTQLYQNLLSEPLHSWRDGVRQFTSSHKHKKCKKTTRGSEKLPETSESPDTISDVSSLSEKDLPHLNLNLTSNSNLVKTVKEDSDRKDYDLVNAVNEQGDNLSSAKNNLMILVPGLKTKPPLPRKSDPNNSYEFKSIASSRDGETNLQESKILTDNSDEGISTTTLDSNSETIDLKYQNWMEDEHRANNEVLKSELDTDLSIHNLKCHNQTESRDSTVKKNLLSNRKTSFKNNSREPFNIEDLKSEYEKHKNQFSSKKNFIKENIKLQSKGNKKASNTRTNYASGSSNKINNSSDQFSNIQQVADVESWMSSKQNNTIEKNKADNNLGLKPLRQSSYLEFLNTIDELEEGCGKCTNEHILEHDIDSSFVEQNDGNTYDDIAAILQVLEQEDKKSHNNMESIKEILDSELCSTTNEGTKENVVDCQLNLDKFATHYSSKCNGNALNKSGIEDCFGPNVGSYKPSGESNEVLRASLNSSTNLNDIITYLDEVDKICVKTVACAKERVNCATQVLQSNVMALDTIPKIEELLKRTNEELSNYIVDLSLRVKEKSSAIALLQKELSSLRQQVTKMNKDSSDIMKQKLRTQKEDYENVVKRHQKFIDQLIADKKTLNQQCEGLLHEMKVLEDRYNSNLKAAEHKHKVEMMKFKEMHMAGEKIRKERWVDVKTQKIKELTIKGLEPELDSMASRHQQEISDIRQFHKREIEDLELRNARKMQQQCEALREQLTTEREKAIAREREILKQRYDKMVEMEEQNFQEQRRKLISEHSNRMLDCEDRENLAIQERDKAIKIAQADFEDKLQASLRRHNTELNVLKEKTELEIEAFRNNYKKQVTIQLGEKEIQIREKCKKERDKEIEAVIERLEMESEETKSHIEQSSENRIKRLKEKYDLEIRDLERLEKDTSTKYAETKNRLLETEDVVINLRATIKHLEFQLTDTKNIADRLSDERHKIKDIVKEEAKLELTTLQKELQELRIEKEKEMQQVYARVKLAVARKDETLTELSRDNASLQEKCTYLENMLEQQRKEYLINKKHH